MPDDSTTSARNQDASSPAPVPDRPRSAPRPRARPLRIWVWASPQMVRLGFMIWGGVMGFGLPLRSWRRFTPHSHVLLGRLQTHKEKRRDAILKVLSPSNVVLGWPQHGSPFNDDLHDALVVSVHVTNNACWMELRQQENKTTAWIHLHGVQRVFLEHMETINVLWSLEITQIGETLELNLNSSVGLSGTIAALSATYSTTPPNC